MTAAVAGFAPLAAAVPFQSTAPAQSDAGASDLDELALQVFEFVAQPDDATAERCLPLWEKLHAAHLEGREDWSRFAWRAYAAAVVRFTEVEPWDFALPEPPTELLARLADDPRTVYDVRVPGDGDLAEFLAYALRYEVQQVGNIEDARRICERVLEQLALESEVRCKWWTTLANDSARVGDYGRALEAGECAQLELDALHGSEDGHARDLRTFELLSARLRIEIGLARSERVALYLEREREVEARVSDDLTREQLLLDEIDVVFTNDNYGPLIERLEADLSTNGLSPTLLERLAYAHLYSNFADPATDERALELLESVRSHPESLALVHSSACVGLAGIYRRRGEFALARERLEQARLGASTVLPGEIAAERGALAIAMGQRGPELDDERRELIDAFDVMLARWASIPLQPDGVGFTNYVDRRALLTELIRVEFARDERAGPELALAHVLRAESHGSLARTFGARLPEVASARERLCGPRRGLLVYVPGPQGGVVFAVDRERIVVEALEMNDRWRESQRALTRLLAVPPDRDRDPARRQLRYAALVERLSQVFFPESVAERLANWDEVTLVGLDMLGYLPFECLLLDGEEFGLAKALSYAPSVVLAMHMSERKAATDAPPRFGIRVLAAPRDPLGAAARYQWAPIAWDGGRESELREIWNGEARIDSGENATWAALRADAGAELAVLEVLAHGFFDPERLPPVGIALAPSREHAGYVYASDVAQLASAPIVVLAVCGAARGPLRSGDEATGHLGGAVLRSGASVVLLATLDLEQSGTEALLDELYRGLAREGDSVASALRRARVELARSERTNDPYYRNLLHCVGLGHERFVVAQAQRSQAVWKRAPWRFGAAMLALVIACAAAIGSVLRRRAELS
jgi:tetratricopeptide (TPR) repeat protein